MHGLWWYVRKVLIMRDQYFNQGMSQRTHCGPIHLNIVTT